MQRYDNFTAGNELWHTAQILFATLCQGRYGRQGTAIPCQAHPKDQSAQQDHHNAQHPIGTGRLSMYSGSHVSKIVAPWIVAGQGKGEFPEAFNQIGMHTDVV